MSVLVRFPFFCGSLLHAGYDRRLFFKLRPRNNQDREVRPTKTMLSRQSMARRSPGVNQGWALPRRVEIDSLS